MDLWNKYKTLLETNGVDSPLRLAHLFAQLEHESGLKSKKENLNYSAKRLLEVFPKYFKSLTEATPFYGNPKAIANRVYANRMGNGNEGSGEGFKYIGRGFLQITGKDNYKNLSEDTGIDFINQPDLLLEEANSMIAALWFWTKIDGNALADEDNLTKITKRINGGVNGFQHRKQLLIKYKELFNDERTN